MGLAAALHAGKWCEGSHFLCHFVWSVGLLPSVLIWTLFDAAQRNIQRYTIEQRDFVLMSRGSMRELGVRVKSIPRATLLYLRAHLHNDRPEYGCAGSIRARSTRPLGDVSHSPMSSLYAERRKGVYAACCVLHAVWWPDTATIAHG